MSWSWIAIFVGILLVVFRAPMVVAPEATLAWFRRFLESAARIRALSALYFALAAGGFAAMNAPRGIALLGSLAFVALAAAIAIWMLAAPASFGRVAGGWLERFEARLGDAGIRAAAALAVVAGLLLIGVGWDGVMNGGGP